MSESLLGSEHRIVFVPSREGFASQNSPYPTLYLADWVAVALRVAQDAAGVSCEKAANAGQGSFKEEEHQAQILDGNQMYFLGPKRIFGTMELGWGKLDYKKDFLISLKKSRVFRFDFCFSKGCLCNLLKQDLRAL